MTPESQDQALAHATAEFPHEACGLIIVVKGKERFWPCRNISSKAADQFIMAPEDFAQAELAGEIVGAGIEVVVVAGFVDSHTPEHD